MKVGIIVYSETGNTLSVAEKLSKELGKRNIVSSIEKIEIGNKARPRKNPFEIVKFPDISKYDVLVFGSFVEGFSLSPVMKEYINSIGKFDGKDVYCYITHFFPFNFLGGTRAISQMNKAVSERNGIIVHNGIVDWKNKKREEQITNIVQNFADLISEL